MKTMPTSPYPVSVSLCLSAADWRKTMAAETTIVDKVPFPKHIGAVMPMRDKDNGLWLVVCFNTQLKTLPEWERVGMVVHEAVHVWQFICQQIGETDHAWEIEAYSVQWITNWLTEGLVDAGWLSDV